ncbi:MAG: circularly permuted type 2 ATP-grasp protein, partial [Desulfamplus sp.]|nr:circularly permuted type 2 ATP-grasp protein [Desulfamplus sp.]
FGSTSLMGIPGLVQAVRSGNVAVSNPLGSGILESPGLIPFLPAICRLLIGEELILQDIPTSWCGQTDALDDALARISDKNNPVIVSSAFAIPHVPVVDTTDLGHDKIEALISKIKVAPYAYVVREPMKPCALPVWGKEGIKKCFASIRMFSAAIASNSAISALIPDATIPAPLSNTAMIPDANIPAKMPGVLTSSGFMTNDGISFITEDKIFVMPGALTRMADNPAILISSSGEGQGSKDTWCFSHKTVEYKSMMHRFTDAIEINRGSDLPSRVADNMLWLGRYVERTEGMLRVLRSVLIRLNSETRLDQIGEFPFLMRIMANFEIISTVMSESDTSYSMRIIETELVESMFSTQRSGSISNSLYNVKRVAASVRDRLSNDSWHILGRMENELAGFAPHRQNQISETQELVNEMILTISAFAGLALESMTRGMGWRFMDMGRRIERAGYMITLLQSIFSSRGKPGSHDLETLLEVADSTITYHTRYRTTLQIEPIVDLLLLDELNPRAVGFQMASLFDHVETLPRSTPRPFRTQEEKITLDLTTHLRLTDIRELMSADIDGARPKLNHLLDFLKNGLQRLSNQITQHYLSRIETEKQLGNFSADHADGTPFSEGEHAYEV